MSIRRWLPLALVLLAALALRVAFWGNLPRQGLISDEAEYLAAAAWLAQGRGFAWHLDWLWTRAPVYPLFLAAHIRLFGFDLVPIFASQVLLSLLNVALVYVLAAQIAPALRPGVPVLAGLLAALYMPFAAYPQMILSETLYLTLLLTAFVVPGLWGGTSGGWFSAVLPVVAGILLGAATLTRGLTLGFVPLVALWVWYVRARRLRSLRPGAEPIWRGLRPALAFALAGVLVVLPWSAYASRAYGGLVVVDTTGGFNLLLGARTAYDGGRSDAPTRNFILALLDERLSQRERATLLEDACLWQHQDERLLTALAQSPANITQAERQSLMTAEGLCLLREVPGAFARKSAAELVDLFQINYTGAERMSGGFSLGRLPPWYTLALFLLDDTLYVLVLPLAVLGWAYAWQRAREGEPGAAVAGALTLLVLLWWLYNLLTAPLLFAINRFRIPLLPFACIYAAVLLVAAWQREGALDAVRRAPLAVLAAVALALAAWSPYAYLQEPPASWASYLGPYPSSLRNTQIALEQRPAYLRQQQLIDALGRGDAAEARALLDAHEMPPHIRRLALPLLAGLEGRPQAGLEMLPELPVLAARNDWQAAVVRGDLLRRLGDEAGAKAAFTPGFVDDQNPVEWAWQWLYPAPTARIDLAGNLDLGYISGFYLGEGDQTEAGDGTFRWSGPEARLLFPAQGSGTPQQLCLRADGRGWPPDMPMPTVRLLLARDRQASDPQPFEALQLQRDVRVYCAEVPPVPPGDDVVLVLRTPTFVPGAADLLAQQGPQAGQLRLLGVRLDWVELAGVEQ